MIVMDKEIYGTYPLKLMITTNLAKIKANLSVLPTLLTNFLLDGIITV